MAGVVMRVGIAASIALLVALVPARADASSSCHEVSDIVGEKKCTRYGAGWAIEGELPFVFHFGMRYGELSTSNTTFKEMDDKQGRPAGYESFRYSGDALGVRSLATLGASGGFSFFVYDQLYMGFEGSFGFGSASTATFTTSNGVKLSRDDGLDVTVFQGGIPVGYRIPLGRASLRGEIMAGFADLQIDHRTDAVGLPSTVSASETRILVEPRIAADIWFTQHISFGVYGGMNVLDMDGRSRALGISLAWHNRSFDGDTSF